MVTVSSAPPSPSLISRLHIFLDEAFSGWLRYGAINPFLSICSSLPDRSSKTINIRNNFNFSFCYKYTKTLPYKNQEFLSPLFQFDHSHFYFPNSRPLPGLIRKEATVKVVKSAACLVPLVVTFRSRVSTSIPPGI